MNFDEFAFFNQQLAAMLRDGIPLEGALRQLVSGMRAGPLRDELQKFETDLANGVPLQQALRARRLPEFYVTMLEVGAQSNNMPAVLTLVADHYRRCYTLLTRLKGLMIYPLLVLVGAFVLSGLLTVLVLKVIQPSFSALLGGLYRVPILHVGVLWASPLVLGLCVLAVFIAVGVPRVRRALRWRLPAFKESSLAQVASALALMLRSGVQLDRALALAEQLERGTIASLELAQWRARLAAGHGKFNDMARPGRAFTPLFTWLVAYGGEDLAAGFARAAEFYQARASYRTDLLLYSALPCAVMLLAVVILGQISPVAWAVVEFLRGVGVFAE